MAKKKIVARVNYPVDVEIEVDESKDEQEIRNAILEQADYQFECGTVSPVVDRVEVVK